MDDFAKGYSCAVATLIRLDGSVSTNARELFRAGGWSIEELMKIRIDFTDLDLLKQHRNELET